MLRFRFVVQRLSIFMILRRTDGGVREEMRLAGLSLGQEADAGLLEAV